jgi:hypothetical protein
LWAEYEFGPFSFGLLTDTVVVKTGEPVSVIKDNPFRDLVPVDQVINTKKLSAALLGPIISLWFLGFAWAWVREGFRAPK